MQKPLWLIVLGVSILIDIFLALSWAQYLWIQRQLSRPLVAFAADFSRSAIYEVPFRQARVPKTGFAVCLTGERQDELGRAAADGKINLEWTVSDRAGRELGRERPAFTGRYVLGAQTVPAALCRWNAIPGQEGTLKITVTVKDNGETPVPRPGQLTVQPFFAHLSVILLLNGGFLFASLLSTFIFSYLYFRTVRREVSESG